MVKKSGTKIMPKSGSAFDDARFTFAGPRSLFFACLHIRDRVTPNDTLNNSANDSVRKLGSKMQHSWNLFSCRNRIE
jgi:hypothetical protein